MNRPGIADARPWRCTTVPGIILLAGRASPGRSFQLPGKLQRAWNEATERQPGQSHAGLRLEVHSWPTTACPGHQHHRLAGVDVGALPLGRLLSHHDTAHRVIGNKGPQTAAGCSEARRAASCRQIITRRSAAGLPFGVGRQAPRPQQKLATGEP